MRPSFEDHAGTATPALPWQRRLSRCYGNAEAPCSTGSLPLFRKRCATGGIQCVGVSRTRAYCKPTELFDPFSALEPLLICAVFSPFSDAGWSLTALRERLPTLARNNFPAGLLLKRTRYGPAATYTRTTLAASSGEEKNSRARTLLPTRRWPKSRPRTSL